MMTTLQLRDISMVIDEVESKYGLECTVNFSSDSCGDSAVLVTVGTDTAETYFDLLCVDAESIWEVCPGNGLYSHEALTAKLISRVAETRGV